MSKMKMMRRLLIVLLFVSIQVAWAEVYRWVDDQGRVHFSDRPKADGAQTFEIKEQNPTSQKGQKDPLSERQRREKQQRLLDIYKEDRAGKRKAREQKQTEKRKREANCAKARDELKSYQGVRLYESTPDGGMRFLSDDERSAEVQRMERLVAYWCK